MGGGLTQLLESLDTRWLVACFAAGVLVLLSGGFWLVEGAVRLARRSGVSTLVIGLTIVAMGTSAPELFLNLAAAVAGHTDLSFGNVVGSNIANVGLVLGLAAVIRPLAVHGRVIARELPLLIGASCALAALAFVDLDLPQGAVPRGVGRLEGALLLALFGALSWLWYRLAVRDRSDPLVREAAAEASRPRSSGLAAAGLLAAGLAALVAGGMLAESSAVSLALRLEAPQALVGVTIVAVATSLPEVAASTVASARGHVDLAVGNVIGSNLFNILLVLGATALCAPVPLPAEVGWHGVRIAWWDLAVMVAFAAVLYPLCRRRRGGIRRSEGLLLLAGYAGYLGVRVAMS